MIPKTVDEGRHLGNVGLVAEVFETVIGDDTFGIYSLLEQLQRGVAGVFQKLVATLNQQIQVGDIGGSESRQRVVSKLHQSLIHLEAVASDRITRHKNEPPVGFLDTLDGFIKRLKGGPDKDVDKIDQLLARLGLGGVQLPHDSGELPLVGL